MRGFSILGIALAIAIVALFAGVVLLGGELVRLSAIRATVAQIGGYNAAVAAFRERFGYVPGDLPAGLAASLGLFAESTRGGMPGHQDGNGRIEGGGVDLADGVGETLGFWRHLADASLIDEQLGTLISGNPLDPGTGEAVLPIPIAPAGSLFPVVRLDQDCHVLVYAAGADHYFELTRVVEMPTSGAFVLDYALSPLDARDLDSKMDDGEPATGAVSAWRHTSLWYGDAVPNPCVTVEGHYNLQGAARGVRACQLRVRMQQ